MSGWADWLCEEGFGDKGCDRHPDCGGLLGDRSDNEAGSERAAFCQGCGWGG